MNGLDELRGKIEARRDDFQNKLEKRLDPTIGANYTMRATNECNIYEARVQELNEVLSELGKIKEPSQKIEAAIYGIFDGSIRWDNQCPPERSGAIIALIHLLGASWEKAHEIASTSCCKNELTSAFSELKVFRERFSAEKGSSGAKA